MIKQTREYTMFKKHDHNKDMVEANVVRIMNSIKTKNLLEYRPILVDEKFQVIDGQHRLEAARRLEVPIFYEVKKGVEPREMILLNQNSFNWKMEDYLKFYVQEGNDNYIKLKRFIEKHDSTLKAVLVLFGKRGGSQYRSNGFKAGGFIFPSPEEEERGNLILERTRHFLDFVKPKIDKPNGYLNGANFQRAMYLFLSIEAVDFEIFMGKVAQRLDLIQCHSRILLYVKMLKQIYNFRNRQPIALEDDSIVLE